MSKIKIMRSINNNHISHFPEIRLKDKTKRPWNLMMMAIYKNDKDKHSFEDYQNFLENFTPIEKNRNVKPKITEQKVKEPSYFFDIIEPDTGLDTIKEPISTSCLPIEEEISEEKEEGRDIVGLMRPRLNAKNSKSGIFGQKEKNKRTSIILLPSPRNNNANSVKQRSMSFFKTPIKMRSNLKEKIDLQKYKKYVPRNQMGRTAENRSRSCELKSLNEVLRKTGDESMDLTAEGIYEEVGNSGNLPYQLIDDFTLRILVFKMIDEIKGYKTNPSNTVRYRRNSFDMSEASETNQTQRAKDNKPKIKRLRSEFLYSAKELHLKHSFVRWLGSNSYSSKRGFKIPKQNSKFNLPWYTKKFVKFNKRLWQLRNVVEEVCLKAVFIPKEERIRIAKLEAKKRRRFRRKVERKTSKALLNEIVDCVDLKHLHKIIEYLVEDNIYSKKLDLSISNDDSIEQLGSKLLFGGTATKNSILLSSRRKIKIENGKMTRQSKLRDTHSEHKNSLINMVNRNDKIAQAKVNRIKSLLFEIRNLDPHLTPEEVEWKDGVDNMIKDMFLESETSKKYKNLIKEDEERVLKKLVKVGKANDMGKIIDFETKAKRSKFGSILQRKIPLLKILTQVTRKTDESDSDRYIQVKSGKNKNEQFFIKGKAGKKSKRALSRKEGSFEPRVYIIKNKFFDKNMIGKIENRRAASKISKIRTCQTENSLTLGLTSRSYRNFKFLKTTNGTFFKRKKKFKTSEKSKIQKKKNFPYDFAESFNARNYKKPITKSASFRVITGKRNSSAKPTKKRN